MACKRDVLMMCMCSGTILAVCEAAGCGDGTELNLTERFVYPVDTNSYHTPFEHLWKFGRHSSIQLKMQQ